MRRLRSWKAVVAAGIIAAVVFVVVFIEGDFARDLTRLPALIGDLLNRIGPAASFVLLYVEESGIPLPVPGDFYLAYLGKVYSESFLDLFEAWIGIIVAVLAGSTNLYWISRRWGPSLLLSPVVREVLGLSESRLERIHGWVSRWGPLAIIFGRYIPGFRVAVTFLAATAGVSYGLFIPSVAISTAIWAAAGLWLGATFGQSIGELLARFPWLYAVAIGLVVIGLAVILVRIWIVESEQLRLRRPA